MLDTRGIRQTKTGRWEATISHPLLPGGRITRNFVDLEQASAYKAAVLALLKRGSVPPELTRAGRRSNPTLKRKVRTRPAPPRAAPLTPGKRTELHDMLGAYLEADNVNIAASDRPLVELLRRTMTGTVDGLSVVWVDAWVRSMKEELRLTPGSIRKRVECLARCLDWWHRTHPDAALKSGLLNPMRMLPRGYSAYRPDPLGEPVPRDRHRDRRLNPGEQERIESALTGERRPDRERPWAPGGDPDMLVFFRLLLGTGLRLREAYCLRVADLRFKLATIDIRMSKTGATREVPMTPAVEAMLSEYTGHQDASRLVFPFWDGLRDAVALRQTTSRLSGRFRTLFDYAECQDLVEHDLRHEATCRWVEMRDVRGNWLFRAEEVRRITGHKSDAMFMRYLSLRGSDLAARMRPASVS
jgi:integrase